jgi:hypothetical protein
MVLPRYTTNCPTRCSSSAEATAERRWSAVAGNLDRWARGEPLENMVRYPDQYLLGIDLFKSLK